MLGNLVCGSATGSGISHKAIGQLRNSLTRFGGKAVSYLQSEKSEDLLTFGPFCARVILENGCAALLGRLDPFRLMYLSEYQAQPEYDTNKRARSAFSWTGDVIPEDKSSLNMWSAEHDVPKISRSLFSRYVDHMYWRPAVDDMLDSLSDFSDDPGIVDLLDIDSDTFIEQMKGRCSLLYSNLSKGVHWEFFSSSLQYDDITVKTGIRDACLAIARLALVSHYVPTAFSALSAGDAVNAYLKFRSELS